MSLRIACIQVAPHIGDLTANSQLTVDAIETGARLQADVIVLPELVTSGYVFESRAEAASTAVATGDVVFAAWARALGGSSAVAVGGFCERGADGVLYNSVAAVSRQGALGYYRKRHLWGRESAIFESGDREPPVIEIAGARLSFVICHDIEYPEVARDLAVRGAQLLAVPMNWPRVRRPPGARAGSTNAAMQAARANRIFVACCDRAGRERGQDWVGESVIVDPSGCVAGAVGPDGVALADVDLPSPLGATVEQGADLFADGSLGTTRAAGVGRIELVHEQLNG